MKHLCLSLVIVVLVVQAGLGRPEPPSAKKPHHKHNGTQLLKKKGLGARTSGTHHLHTHRGHHTYVTLKRGKVTGLHMKTPGGKRLTPRRVRKTASLPLDRDERAVVDRDTTFVSLDDTVPVRDGGMIGFTFQTPFFTITIWFPASAVDQGGGDPSGGDPSGGDDA